MQETDHPIVSGADLFEAVHSNTMAGRAVECVVVAVALDVVLDDMGPWKSEYWRARLVEVVDVYRSQRAEHEAALVAEIEAQL